MTRTKSALDKALVDAHNAGNKAEIARLYEEAGNVFEADGDVDGAAFYLTHAYVFALEIGSSRADQLQERLHRLGREVPPSKEL
ncbi:MAG: hypothetical protein AAGE89_07125 [Pseudomonadota bacterium]